MSGSTKHPGKTIDLEITYAFSCLQKEREMYSGQSKWFCKHYYIAEEAKAQKWMAMHLLSCFLNVSAGLDNLWRHEDLRWPEPAPGELKLIGGWEDMNPLVESWGGRDPISNQSCRIHLTLPCCFFFCKHTLQMGRTQVWSQNTRFLNLIPVSSFSISHFLL